MLSPLTRENINSCHSYLSADYERETFNVSACKWVEGAEENIVTIPSKDSDSTSSPTPGDPSFSGGAIAGIVIGAIFAAIIIAVIIALIIWRQRKKAEYAISDPDPDMGVITGPVHNGTPALGIKYYSPESLGTTTHGSNGESNGGRVTGQSGQDSNGRDTHNITDTEELDGDSQQIYQLHGVSMAPPSDNEAPIYHELGGSEVRKLESDPVSSVGTTPSPNKRNGKGDEPPSPFVSTLGTVGWGEERGDASSDLVSPTTPVHHRARDSLETLPEN